MAASSTTMTAAPIECDFPFPPEPSEGGRTDVVVEICNHPLDRLISQVGILVENFSPDARGRIKQSMELDLMNKAHLSRLESKLRARGDARSVRVANSIVSRVQQASQETMSDIFPMRRHLKDIAANLNELIELGTLENEDDTQAIISEIEESAKCAFEAAESGSKKYADVTQTLKEMSEEFAMEAANYTKEAALYETNANEHKKLAEDHDEKAKLNSKSFTYSCFGSSSLGVLSAAGVIMYPACLAAAGVGSGIAVIFGAVAAWQMHERCDKLQKSVECKVKASEFTRKSEESRKIAEHAQDSSKVNESIVEVAEVNMSMWSGIRIAAREASASLKKLNGMNPHGSRRAAFERRMKDFGQQLILFVTAIDEYLFHMSKTAYFPPNLNLRRVIGVDAYDAMQEAMNQTTVLPLLG